MKYDRIIYFLDEKYFYTFRGKSPFDGIYRKNNTFPLFGGKVHFTGFIYDDGSMLLSGSFAPFKKSVKLSFDVSTVTSVYLFLNPIRLMFESVLKSKSSPLK